MGNVRSFFSSRFSQAQVCENSDGNINDTISGLNPTLLSNENVFRSVCNTQGYFANSWFHTNLACDPEVKKVDKLREKYWSHMNPKLADLEKKLEIARRGLFPEYEQFKPIREYFRKIARTVRSS